MTAGTLENGNSRSCLLHVPTGYQAGRHYPLVVVLHGAFEIRDYAPHVVAETLVEGTLEEAGNTAFNMLFRYISGDNRSREKVAMTAPEDPQVTLRQVPARRIAPVRYSGSWSEKGYRRNLEGLESWMRGNGLAPAGEPVWARHNSPFSLWFLRRNEILVPVATTVD